MKKRHFADPLFETSTALVAWSVVALTAVLIGIVYQSSVPALRIFGWSFLWTKAWNPVTENFGALPMIYGTIVSSLLALAIAVPLSLGIAIYLSELSPLWIRQPLSLLIELLAAIPSVIYGLWGIFVLAPFLRTMVQPFLARYFGFLPFFRGPYYGIGMLAAGTILSIMIIPTIASVSREVFATVPQSLKEGSLAMGSTRWEMMKLAVLPVSRSGILGAVLLGLGRALGETMAVTMLIGNRSEISLSFFAPGYTLASVIANEFSEAVSTIHTAALMEIGLILLALTLLLNIVARTLVWSVSGKVEKGFHGV